MADVSTIDESKLPGTALFDTSVLIPALRGTTKASEDPACPALFNAMIAAHRNILIAAPSAAEIFRRSPTDSIPRVALIRVVPFDLLAAEILGKRFPPDVLTSFKDPSKPRPVDYIKYDAMILACAIRHRADVLISTDENRRPMATKVGLEMHVPSDYLKPTPPQSILFSPNVMEPKAAKRPTLGS